MNVLASEPQIEGDLFLFRQPELLDASRHGSMGLIAPTRPFGFAADAYTVPIVVSELVTAQKHYPIVFSSTEDPVLLAVLGLKDGPNLFVDEFGRWEPGCYIPVYLRSYPFAFAETEDDDVAVLIDVAAETVSETPVEPFFDAGNLSAPTQAKVDLFSRQVIERQKTREFCSLMAEAGLLTGQQVVRTVEGEPRQLASYTAVDAKKLEALSAEELWQAHRQGLLAAIYAHIFSLDNWSPLLERQSLRGGKFDA